MSKDLLKGILFTLGILSLFGIVFAVGFHTANEITSGTFSGDYIFNGNLNFNNATIVGNGSSSMFTGWPDVIVCENPDNRVWTYVLASIPDGAGLVRYVSPSGDGGSDRYLRYNFAKTYYDQGGTTGFDCVSSSMSIQDLYDSGQAFNLVGGFDNHKINCPSGFTSVESNGKQLGCIQNDEQGTGTWFEALQNCWQNYGGKLPSYAQWYLGTYFYSLNNEIGNYEWLDDLTINSGTTYSVSVVGNSDLTTTTSALKTDNYYYRCFIPN